MYSLDQDWSSTVILFMMVFLFFFFFLGPTADGVSFSFRRSSASLNPGRLRLKGPERWRNVLFHVAFLGRQEVRTPTEEILLFVILLKIEGKWKKREEKRERDSSSSGACTDFRRRRGPPPSYVTPAACVTGWVTSVAPGGRRRTGAGKHTRNPPGTHWRCTDHFAFPHAAPPFNLPLTLASTHVHFTVLVCVTVRTRFFF